VKSTRDDFAALLNNEGPGHVRGHPHVAVHHRLEKDDETDNDIPVIDKTVC